MAAHDVQDDEIVLRRIDLCKIGEQRFIVFIGEVVGVIRPFGMVCGLGDQRDGAVVLAVAA